MGLADEEPLCADLAAGRDEAFAQLIREYGAPLYRAALALVGDRHDAEEVVQEVFVALVRSRERLAAVVNLRAYLFASVRRASIRRLTRRKEQNRALNVLANETPAPPNCPTLDAPDERGEQLRAAVAQLPLEQREVITLKLDGELTFREIGELLEKGYRSMAQLLFGLEAWLASLLWAVFLIAWYARRRSWWRLLLFIAGLLLLMVPWFLALPVLSAFYWPRPWESPGVLFGMLLLVTLLVAFGVAAVRGLRRQPASGIGLASHWPLGRLAVAALVATVLAHSTLWMFDAQSRDNLTDLRREAQVLAQSVTPRPLLDADNAAPLYYVAFDALGTNYQPPADPRPQPQILAEEEARPKLDAAPEQPGVPDFHTLYWTDLIMIDEPGYDFKSPRLAALLERNRHVRDMLIQAVKIPACSFDRDYTRPANDYRLPEIQNFRSAARYLRIDARQAAAVGDGARAAADLQAIYGMAGHCAQEPWLVRMLVAIALENVAGETLREVLAHSSEPAPELLAFTPPDQMPYLLVLDRSLRAEEAVGMMTISQMDFDIRQFDPLVWEGGASVSHLLGIYGAPLVRVCFLDATAADLRRTYRQLRDLNANLRNPDKATIDRLNSLGDDDRHTPLVKLLIPSITSCDRAAVRGETRRRLLRVALGLYRYYHAPGDGGEPRHQFPDSLAALVPDYLDYIPSDPCNHGQPLRYRRTDGGCLVYGFGWDLTDNGGVSDKEHPDQGDMVFECLAPPKPGG